MRVTMRLAIILGPYRNLSTLTAATLSLHPECLALNHAAERLLADPKSDFFTHANPETLAHFIEAAREASTTRKRGNLGGSILHSHAYDDTALSALYAKRFGANEIKPKAECLVWKDSMRVQKRLMAEKGLFDRLCSAFPDIRFLLPMRDILDCTQSNLSTAHIKFLGGSRRMPIVRAVDRVLDAFVWALEQRERHPDRVFVLTQGDDPPAIFSALADFLGLSRDKTWLGDVSDAFKIRPGPEHDPQAVAYALKATRTRFARWPEILERMGYQARIYPL